MPFPRGTTGRASSIKDKKAAIVPRGNCPRKLEPLKEILLPFPGILSRLRGVLPRRSPSVEGGPAGSGVFVATSSAAPERHGGAVLGEIKKELFPDISQKSGSMYLRRPSAGPLPRVRSPPPGGRGARGKSRAKPERGTSRNLEKNQKKGARTGVRAPIRVSGRLTSAASGRGVGAAGPSDGPSVSGRSGPRWAGRRPDGRAGRPRGQPGARGPRSATGESRALPAARG